MVQKIETKMTSDSVAKLTYIRETILILDKAASQGGYYISNANYIDSVYTGDVTTQWTITITFT